MPLQLLRALWSKIPVAAIGCHLWAVGLQLVLISAHAASLHVDPTSFSLGSQTKSSVLHVTNADDKPVRLQVSVVRWMLNAEGRQEESPTDSIILNPPIFQLAPNQTQFIRFGPRKSITGNSEESYRILVEEVPDKSVETAGIHTILRISVPLFLSATKPEPRLVGSLVPSADGETLSLQNDGNGHVHIFKIFWQGEPEGTRMISVTPLYLLPTESHSWTLTDNHPASSPRKLSVLTDRGEQEVLVGPAGHQP